MKRGPMTSLNSLETEAKRLNSELSRISGSEKAEDVARCAWIKRELTRITTDYLKVFDGH